MLRLGIASLLSSFLLAAPARAQTPAGDGLVGQYYDGQNFERVMVIRHDATIDFDWTGSEPAPGVPAEHFSVRWTGWLVPPVSGRYKFHVTVDDGMRLWINERQILNEWRDQPVRQYTATVELTAGQAYRLRVDYYQNILDNRARLTWERPDAAKQPPPTWRNGWNMGSQPSGAEPIPSRYLYRKPPPNATTAQAAAPAPAKPTDQAAAATGGPAPGSNPSASPSPPARPKPLAVPAPKPLPAPATIPAPRPSIDSAAARVARLDEGEAVTLPDLYFDQGQAQLLPAARAALDDLAVALRARPGLRLEVQGHTDNVGVPELNRQLSQQRAEAVCRYLAAHGVPDGQLRPVGYGGTRPVADNTDPAQRPKNRRVVLVKLQ
ncbi:hypothetical protein GCM10023185_13950 [Hymenobacter saemangeumensis]|uniref:OmpA family protein n=1 Tax=Hymenobacter saemangeumensis TaxID=1084522 RepID=A0ABP8I8E1_9BACT